MMIRRHKIPVVLATVVGFAVGFLLTLPEPRIYQAKTTMEIQGRPVVIYVDVPVGANLSIINPAQVRLKE